jgi:hypothetical protein|nr:MAG TPA: hypothetical protein [Caudoviricetes sp.]DAV89103.1 MAG TPA: hypothetical protein [Caudoviricetes sp.]
MLNIKDYLVLKNIETYLKEKKDELLIENNDYSNLPIEEIEKLLINLKKILNKLENEE